MRTRSAPSSRASSAIPAWPGSNSTDCRPRRVPRRPAHPGRVTRRRYRREERHRAGAAGASPACPSGSARRGPVRSAARSTCPSPTSRPPAPTGSPAAASADEANEADTRQKPIATTGESAGIQRLRGLHPLTGPSLEACQANGVPACRSSCGHRRPAYAGPRRCRRATGPHRQRRVPRSAAGGSVEAPR